MSLLGYNNYTCGPQKDYGKSPVVSLNVRIGFWFLDEVRWVKKHNLERKDSQKKKYPIIYIQKKKYVTANWILSLKYNVL